MIGPVDEQEPILPEDPIERQYAVREARVRIHQARFRGRVVPAYRDQCAICRLDRGSIYVPRKAEWKPDRERLALRFDRFRERAA